METKICMACGKDFLGDYAFCSKSCCSLRSIIKNCSNCNTSIKVPKHKLKINNFCSQNCYYATRNKGKSFSFLKETKVCKKCNEEKPLKKFSPQIKNGKFVCSNLCNPCKHKIYRHGAENPVSMDRNTVKEGQETKICVKCNEEKPLYSFPKYKKANNSIGRGAKCNGCKNNLLVVRRTYKPYLKKGSWVKFCVNCGQTKSLDEFAKCLKSYGYCKVCRKVKANKWYHKNLKTSPERIQKKRESSAKHYRNVRKKLYPEINAKRRERWRKDSEYRERRLSYYRNLPIEKKREIRKKYKYPYKSTNAVKRGALAYRARKINANIIIPFTKADIIKRDGLDCYLCGKKLTGKSAVIEHLIPLSRGGNHKAENVKIACRNCNSSKRNKTVTEFKKWRGDYSRFDKCQSSQKRQL